MWKYSWKNLTLFMLSIPQYESKEDTGDAKEVEDLSELGDLF
jgi:hypothetical protein